MYTPGKGPTIRLYGGMCVEYICELKLVSSHPPNCLFACEVHGYIHIQTIETNGLFSYELGILNSFGVILLAPYKSNDKRFCGLNWCKLELVWVRANLSCT